MFFLWLDIDFFFKSVSLEFRIIIKFCECGCRVVGNNIENMRCLGDVLKLFVNYSKIVI